jgi:hypothetical protein
MKLPNHAGIVAYRKVRSTGTRVGLYHAEEAGIDSDPETPWMTVCEDHGNMVGHGTRRLAEQALSHPEDWCDQCQQAYQERPGAG